MRNNTQTLVIICLPIMLITALFIFVPKQLEYIMFILMCLTGIGFVHIGIDSVANEIKAPLIIKIPLIIVIATVGIVFSTLLGINVLMWVGIL